MTNVYSTVADLIGATPILRARRLEERLGLHAELYLKLEGMNPFGSAKDRVALRMLDDAEEAGILTKDSVIIEPTSGNTGIALAAVALSRGYRTIIVMPDSMSPERCMLMTAYGAELVLTPGSEGMRGAIAEAERIRETCEGAWIAGQFDNPSNPRAHYVSTGPEIYRAMDGRVDLFVAGVGTGGTITGVGRYLKEQNPETRVVAVEPAGSPILSGGEAGAHGLQGIGAGFVPSVLDTSVYDEVARVTESEARETCRLLASAEGILVGISSGAALSAALRLAEQQATTGKRIVVLLPDSGERYLSTGLFSKE
jgi:cysteine synthase A